MRLLQRIQSLVRRGVLLAPAVRVVPAVSAALVASAVAAATVAQDRPLFPAGTIAPAGQADGASASGNLPAEPAVSSARGDGTLAAGAASRGILGEVIPTAAALVGTLVVIVLARSAVKRFGGGLGAGRRPSGVVEILARYPVARSQQVVLLKVGRRVIVAHQSSQAMSALSEFTDADEVADILARCEGSRRRTSEFSFDALLRQSGVAYDAASEPAEAGASPKRGEAVRRGGRLPAAVREFLPKSMQGADVETVDLTRGGRGASR